jgi:c-di-GMP-binding flagellar brake protein YcgR
MDEKIPASGIEPGDFRITAAAEILGFLRTLLERQIRVTLGNAAGASLNTSLCAVDAESSALGFDVLTADPQLQSLLSANYVTATAYIDQVRLEFELDNLMLVKSADATRGPVLRAGLPALLYRFQRRQAFRVQPNSRTPQVLLPQPEPESAPLRLRVMDLSIGGLAVLLPPDLAAWKVGREVLARVELDRDIRFETVLRLQHVHAGDTDGTRLGWAFKQLDPTAARDLQRYIDQIQKLSRLLRKA